MRNFIGKCRLEENLHLTVFSVGLTEVWRRCKSLVGLENFCIHMIKASSLP